MSGSRVRFRFLRGLGVQFALDDVGASYAHLDLIARILPKFTKIGHEFGTDFEKDVSLKRPRGRGQVFLFLSQSAPRCRGQVFGFRARTGRFRGRACPFDRTCELNKSPLSR